MILDVTLGEFFGITLSLTLGMALGVTLCVNLDETDTYNLMNIGQPSINSARHNYGVKSSTDLL